MTRLNLAADDDGKHAGVLEVSAETYIYVGTYTEPILFGTGKILEGKGRGIYRYRLDRATGALEAAGATTGVVNPSYLAFDPTRRFLYAVNELKTWQDRPTGTVSAFAVDAGSGALSFLNRQMTHGTDPCHVEVADDGRHIFVANFMSGSVCVLPVNPDGSLAPASDFIQHQGASIDPNRQRGPHAHSVIFSPDAHFAFVPDLGLDKLAAYVVDPLRGKLERHERAWFKATPGAGPRHLAFRPDGRHAYLINELASSLTALAYDGVNGTFRELQTVPTLPADFQGASTCADVHVSPCGGFVYASNRGHDSIVIYRIAGDSGLLSLLGHVSTQGRTPRNFAIDPDGEFLLAANQDSDSIVSFRIKGGALEPTGQVTAVPTPVCIRFYR
jgi:6-phosphogluconolactonase